MKIQPTAHLRVHYGLRPVEVIEESKRFHVAYVGDTYIAFPKSDYEPVPEATWRDVTREIEIQGDCREGAMSALFRHGYWINSTAVEGYRFVKRSLWDCLGESGQAIFFDAQRQAVLQTRWVLTVERKEDLCK